YISQTKCYALEGTARAKGDDQVKYPINFAYFQQAKTDAEILYKRIRCLFPQGENGGVPRYEPFTSLCEYLIYPVVTPEGDESKLNKIRQIIDKMELTMKVKRRYSHGFQFKIDLGGRRQNVRVYVYNKFILVSSQIAAVDDISESQWKGFKSLQAWLWNLTEGIAFGELNIHNGHICLAKRIFHSELSPSFLRFVVTELARSADLYEQKFVGRDML
ncbi:MAG TPA: hypothetical protein VK141_01970, partial [Nitrosomonas sp.]|nr:hypothetical protein [Nitrosomonas sp.]